MRLFKNLFNNTCLSDEFVDEVISEPEPERFSYLSEHGALRVIKLKDPISGKEFEVDLNDKVAFNRLVINSAVDCYI